MSSWTCKRNAYCDGCRHWRYFGGFYGCYRFRVYSLDEFDRLCGGKHRDPR